MRMRDHAYDTWLDSTCFLYSARTHGHVFHHKKPLFHIDICQGLYIDYNPKYQCVAVVEIMPTIYARSLWIKESPNKKKESCVAISIWGNEIGTYCYWKLISMYQLA